MKILHILNHSVPHTDGYCVRSAAIVASQVQLGMAPLVLTSPHQEPVPTRLRETIDGVCYYRTSPFSKRGFPVLHELRAIRRVRQRIDEVVKLERPDVLHAHSPCTWGLAAYLAGKSLRLPVVFEVRGLWEGDRADGGPSLKHRLGCRVEKTLLKRVDRVVVISAPLFDYVSSCRSHGRGVYVVPNGVDTEHFCSRAPDRDLRASLRIADDDVCLGYLGSLYPFEGVVDLVRAMPQITSAMPNVKLIIVGAGPASAEITREISRRGLSSFVRFVGRVPFRDVRRYYSIMDILTYPRRRNRTTELVTPLKPLEAAAMAKPVICSDVGGIKTLLGSDCACYYNAGSVDQLAESCINLAKTPKLRAAMGQLARDYVCDNRTWLSAARRYQEVYSSVLELRHSHDIEQISVDCPKSLEAK